jgi:deoxyribodipyrimidine photo-lyase
VRGREIHEPWRRPEGLPDGYPERIADHAKERSESLANYQALRDRS